MKSVSGGINNINDVIGNIFDHVVNVFDAVGYKTHRVYKLREKKEEDADEATDTLKPLPGRVRIEGKIKI